MVAIDEDAVMGGGGGGGGAADSWLVPMDDEEGEHRDGQAGARPGAADRHPERRLLLLSFGSLSVAAAHGFVSRR